MESMGKLDDKVNTGHPGNLSKVSLIQKTRFLEAIAVIHKYED